MNNLSDNLANQDGGIGDNSGLVNNDDLSSTLDNINQDLNQNLTDGFHQHLSMGLGENVDVMANQEFLEIASGVFLVECEKSW